MGAAPPRIKQPEELGPRACQRVLNGHVSLEGLATKLKSGEIKQVALMVGVREGSYVTEVSVCLYVCVCL